MNVLITGGTGYLGSHVAFDLAVRGHAVTVVARGSASGTSSAERVRQLRSAGVQVLAADLSVPRDLLTQVSPRGVEVVIHAVSNFLEPAGAASLTVQSMAEAVRFAQACPSLRLFVDLANNLAYGDTSRGAPHEGVTADPNTVHGANKLKAEKILRDSKLPWLILRISQVYGGWGSSFDWVVLDRIRRGKLPLPGSGRNRVGLVHIEDVCQAVRLAVEKLIVREVINVCSGDEELTQGALFDFLAARLGVPKPPRIPYPMALIYAVVVERIALLRGQTPEVVQDMIRIMAMDRVLDIGKAQRVLGYQPRYPRTLDGLTAAYAGVFSGQAQPFTPSGRLATVRGN